MTERRVKILGSNIRIKESNSIVDQSLSVGKTLSMREYLNLQVRMGFIDSYDGIHSFIR